MENSTEETTIAAEEDDTGCGDRKKQAALFLLQLKEKTKLQQSVINSVVEGTADLLRNSVQRLKGRVSELLQANGQDAIVLSDNFQDIWKDEVTPFDGLETLHLQEEYQKRTFSYVVSMVV